MLEMDEHQIHRFERLKGYKMAMIFVNIHSHFPYRICHCIMCYNEDIIAGSSFR